MSSWQYLLTVTKLLLLWCLKDNCRNKTNTDRYYFQTCLKWIMMSLESSMSLNIPSSLLVKAAPHSARGKTNTHRTKWIHKNLSSFRFPIHLTQASLRAVERSWQIKLTVLQLWQHRFFSVDRCTFSDKQPFSQILLVKGFKDVFSYNNKEKSIKKYAFKGPKELTSPQRKKYHRWIWKWSWSYPAFSPAPHPLPLCFLLLTWNPRVWLKSTFGFSVIWPFC